MSLHLILTIFFKSLYITLIEFLSFYSDGLSEDSGRGEDDPELTGQTVSSSAQVMTVDMSSLANKAGKAIGPSGGNSIVF